MPGEVALAPSISHLGPDHAIDHGNFLCVNVLGQSLELVVVGEEVGRERERLQVGEELEQCSKSRKCHRSGGIFGNDEVADRFTRDGGGWGSHVAVGEGGVVRERVGQWRARG